MLPTRKNCVLAANRKLKQNKEQKMVAILDRSLDVAIALPKEFTVRGATLEDVEPSLEMYNLWSQSVISEDEIVDVEAIRNEWISPGFDPAKDIRLIFAPDGTLVGYIEAWTTAKPPVHPWIWGRVHPDYSNLGIGTWIYQPILLSLPMELPWMTPNKIAIVWGASMTVAGFGMFLSPIIVGASRDIFGSFVPGFMICVIPASMLIFSGIFLPQNKPVIAASAA